MNPSLTLKVEPPEKMTTPIPIFCSDFFSLVDYNFLWAYLQVKPERVQVEFNIKFDTEDPSLVVKVTPCGKFYGTSIRCWELAPLK